MRKFWFGSAVVASIFLCSPSWSATVEVVKGGVLINRGEGFRPVTGAAEARSGDQVMASPDGSARIIYADGCPIPVNPGAVITVSAKSPCTAFAQRVTPAGGAPEEGLGAAGAVGSVVAAGVIAAILSLKDDDSPASP
jgi:hypothetical protein